MSRIVAVLLLLVMLCAPASTFAGSPQQTYRIEVAPEGLPPLALHVEEWGSGPPLLMLHGLGASTYTWRKLARRMADKHRVIAIDLRGHGRSDKPFDQHYAPAEHAAVVRAFIRQRGLERVTLVGHSFGSFVSLLLAIDPRSSPRIGKLVLMSTPAYRQSYAPAVWLMQAPVLPYLTMLAVPPELPTLVALLMEKGGYGHVTRRDVESYAAPLLDSSGVHALITTARLLEPHDADEIIRRYGAIRQPTLVIHCRHDDVVPITSSLRLSRSIPRARLHVLEECAHIPPEQATEGVARLMGRFLGG